MSQVLKKCPKDGIEYTADYTGTCESCFGPVQFYCKAHDQWLVDETCNKCGAPAAPATPKSDRWFMVIILVLLVVLGASVVTIWRLTTAKRRPPKPPPLPTVSAPPVVTPPPPVPVVVPTGPPLELSISALADDPDRYLGKLVKTQGVLQLKDTFKESFDLRQGDYALQVQYGGTSPTAKATVAAIPIGRDLSVTGILRRDESLNALYITAQRLEPR